MNEVISQTSNGLLEALKGKKPPKPEGATTIYHVHWHLASDEFDGLGMRVSSSPTPTRMSRKKTFISKDRAEALVKSLNEAFTTLEYQWQGRAWIEEDYLE